MGYETLEETALEDLAQKNDPAALYEKGIRLRAADDKAQAIKYLRLAQQLGWVPACYELGRLYLDVNRNADALDAFREGRRGGDERSAFAYAVLMLFEKGDAESMDYIVTLGDEGDPDAIRILKQFYTDAGNKREAEYWRKKGEKIAQKETQK